MTPMRIAGHAAWSALGPQPGALAEALRGDASGPPRHRRADLPPPGIVPAPGFDPAVAIGPKGIRTMDRATAMAVWATGRLLEHDETDPARTGLVLGTASGSLQAIMDFLAESRTRPKPYQVDPGRFPVTIMNYAAGQCAIRHRLTGPNTTVAAGPAAVALSLRYASRLLDSGRADQVLCGAAEEATESRAWHRWHTRRSGATPPPIGEGCAMLRLVPADAGPGPRLLSVAIGLRPLADVTRDALAEAAVRAEDVWAVAAADPDDPEETATLRGVFGDSGTARISLGPLTGDTSAVTGALALVALVELAATEPASAGRNFATTAIDPSGLACCVIGRN